jgi:hypothetical protein
VRRTLVEVSEATGRPVGLLKKHVQRGKLRATKEKGRIVIDDADLAAYLHSELVAKAAERTRGQPLDVVEAEVAKLFEHKP